METKQRSILKAFTWRINGLLVTTAVVWIITGQPAVAVFVGMLDTVVKLMAYYVHERVWLKIQYGKE